MKLKEIIGKHPSENPETLAPSTPEITSTKLSTSSSHEEISPAETESSSYNEDPVASQHATESTRLHVVTTIIGLKSILGIAGEHGITSETHLLDEAKELADATGVSYKHMKMPKEDDEEGQLRSASLLLYRVRETAGIKEHQTSW